MANPTMTLIGSPITVGSGGVSSVTFSSIPATYTDLIVKASTRSTDTSANFTAIGMQLNGNESSASWKLLYGNGSGAYSGSNSGYADTGFSSSANTTTNTFANMEIYLPNYTSSNYKSWSVDSTTENNATEAIASMRAGLWSNTAAITSIALSSRAGNFIQYSTFYLYGISNS